MYGYEHFHRGLMVKDLAFTHGPMPGEAMPDFDLPTLDGDRLRARDLRGRPTLITFGSVTCPMTRDSGPILHRLHEEFGDRVRFVTLYVREMHPGDRFPQTRTMDQKMHHARVYRDRDDIRWTVAVDDPNGSLHRCLDPKPNAAYLVDENGRVAFRTLWTNDERVLRNGIREVLAKGGPIRQRQPHVVPMMRGVARMDEMLSFSGPTARADVRREMPPVYAMALALARPRLLATVLGGVATVLAIAMAIGGAALLRGTGQPKSRSTASSARSTSPDVV